MRARLRDPVWWTNALQIIKTVLAAVVAWVLAVHVFDIEQAFLAPWAALLTVHATVYRTLRRGVQQVGATVLGVLVAFALGSVFGLNALSLGLAILVGLIAGSVRGLRAETTTGRYGSRARARSTPTSTAPGASWGRRARAAS
jgi:cell shape-determining protein MreD